MANMAKKIRLEVSEEEAAHVLRYLENCCDDDLLADVYFRLQALMARREPKRF